MTSQVNKVLAEGAGLLRSPQRIFPLLQRIAHDKIRATFAPGHLYSYTKTQQPSRDSLNSLIRWILAAQRPNGGIAAYYSLLSGYSDSYPEVTGYIVPTLYAFARVSGDETARHAAERATQWL